MCQQLPFRISHTERVFISSQSLSVFFLYSCTTASELIACEGLCCGFMLPD